MKDIKNYIKAYWQERAADFSKLREEELHSEKKLLWEEELKRHLSSNKKLNILDVGCGPGFFSIVLAKCGHQVTGIDVTKEMIDGARYLAKKEKVNATFLVMDGEKLSFTPGSFDVVIARNLTWNLPNPKEAYAQWWKVLNEGGVLLNYDAEYAKEHQNKEWKESGAHKEISESLLEKCQQMYQQLPIGLQDRPAWDMAVLEELGAIHITIDQKVGQRIYKEKDKFYVQAPMFLLKAYKKGAHF